ncbi:hypothetical protein BU16DRAFT_50048 [Lophium mytilinum]|uniref:Uncharacterized protein n=1 Tax=Lophium mytilinum TaxID=390894 RepID=A0A6A6QRV4_9PEZI|nr:hypothetical protein BU16DRAFT_50048 [Lophium mytilinum]
MKESIIMPTSANSTAISTRPSIPFLVQVQHYIATHALLLLAVAYILGRYNAVTHLFRAAYRTLKFVLISIDRRPLLLGLTPVVIIWLYFNLQDRDCVPLWRSDRAWLTEVRHALWIMRECFYGGWACERKRYREECGWLG